MKKIMIFAGTTEGRRLSEWLCENGILHIVSVATAYGEQVLSAHPCAKVHQGRMDASAMKEFFLQEQVEVVVDATHPYAQEVTENIKQAVTGTAVNYMRLVREIQGTENQKAIKGKVIYVPTHETCEQELLRTQGNILLTTGSKDLAKYCIHEEVKKRLVVRVLPGQESLALCEEQRLAGKQVVAMQGPFSEEMNLAIIHQYNIGCMVTKQSGKNGGFEEKLSAAEKAGIPVYVIGCPVQEEGYTLSEICQELGLQSPSQTSYMEIQLIGCGMGNMSALTVDAGQRIEQADIILGASRLIEPYTARLESRPYYLAKDIIPYLKECQQKEQGPLSVAVLFSGDTGFYSGCRKLWDALKQAVDNRELHAKLEVVPGISSIVYLAAKLHESWEDAAILSIHGKGEMKNWGAEVLEAVRYHKKTFILVSGAEHIAELGRLLQKRGCGECVITVGYNLSYETECIRVLTADACARLEQGLYTCLIKNPNFEEKPCTVHIADEDFIRGHVPMTKAEIRTLSIAGLRLKQNSIVYDIGSGTGSVAVEMAGMSGNIKVYAIERKKEAIALIRENREKFGRENIQIVEAFAPEGLEELPAPTHAFIGGSGGHLMEILQALQKKNPSMRVVLNAVSMETMQACLQIERCFPVKDFQMIQAAITRTGQVGDYHMLQGENPIWICSFEFREKG